MTIFDIKRKLGNYSKEAQDEALSEITNNRTIVNRINQMGAQLRTINTNKDQLFNLKLFGILKLFGGPKMLVFSTTNKYSNQEVLAIKLFYQAADQAVLAASNQAVLAGSNQAVLAASNQAVIAASNQAVLAASKQAVLKQTDSGFSSLPTVTNLTSALLPLKQT